MTLREHRTKVLDEPLATVAQRAGLSIPTLSYIERGMAPRKRHYPRLLRGYRLKADELQTMLAQEASCSKK